VPGARLGWPSRQILSARKYTVSYRVVSYRCGANNWDLCSTTRWLV